MINIIICDDEIECINDISNAISEYFKSISNSYNIQRFNSSEDLFNANIDYNNIDIVFLDINMPNMSGFEAAKKIRDLNQNINIAFITALLDYTIEGYKIRVFRYIVKNNINFALQIFECLDALLKNIEYNQATISFPVSTGTIAIKPENIIYVESELHNVSIYIKEHNESLQCKHLKLDEIEKLLKRYKFIRVHKSFLVNPKYIISMTNKEVKLHRVDKYIPVARSKYNQAFKEYFMYEGEQ